MKAKKSFGQHFLIQKKIIDRIIEKILEQHITNILEVGPGKGAITKGLLKENINLKAVELDRDMIAILHHEYPELKDKIIEKDFLKVDLANSFGGQEFLLCGNFPYNISSQIVFSTLRYASYIPVMLGMFQKEMAQRICAKEGNKNYGILSVLVPLMYEAKLEFDIGKNNFSPPPKVTSSILLLKRKADYLSVQEYEILRKLTKAAFQFRRKTLRNNFKMLVREPDLLSDVYFEQRPEDISPQEYLRLSKTLLLN